MPLKMVHITRICLRKVSTIEDLYRECHIFNGGYYTVFDISWKANSTLNTPSSNRVCLSCGMLDDTPTISIAIAHEQPAGDCL